MLVSLVPCIGAKRSKEVPPAGGGVVFPMSMGHGLSAQRSAITVVMSESSGGLTDGAIWVI